MHKDICSHRNIADTINDNYNDNNSNSDGNGNNNSNVFMMGVS